MNEEADAIKNLAHDDLKVHYDFDYSRAKPNRFAEQLARIEEVFTRFEPVLSEMPQLQQTTLFPEYATNAGTPKPVNVASISAAQMGLM